MSIDDNKIKELLGGKYTQKFDTESYHSDFIISGQGKAKDVLSSLKDKDLDYSRCAYFSIGGSSGGEIEYILNQTKTQYGIILEYDPALTERLSNLRKTYKERQKCLEYVPGDASQQIDYCNSILKSWMDKGYIDIVICSAQAVFHELPFRSPSYNVNAFLHKILYGWKRCIFATREPCKPVGWPSRIGIKLNNISKDSLFNIASDIKNSLSFKCKIHLIGDYVEMSASLAIETLFKLFYIDSYRHEIQEKVTHLKADEFILSIETILGNNTVTSSYLNSEGFENRYRQYGVTAINVRNRKPLQIPKTFIKIIADSFYSELQTKPLRKDDQVDISDNCIIVTPSKRSRHKKKTNRYLRRRCRIIMPGSVDFNETIYLLLSHKYNTIEASEVFFQKIHKFKDPYERVMAEAAFSENIGKIESMIEVLGGDTFHEKRESTRLLYMAIAYEKLDNIPKAIDCLFRVLSKESDYNIIKAAQFNLNLCYEKNKKYRRVDFESFIGIQDIKFIDHERLSDKAIAMQLIYCLQINKSFIYEKNLKESLNFLFTANKIGYIKTFLTYSLLKNDNIDVELLKEFQEEAKNVDANSRVAILSTMKSYINKMDYDIDSSMLQEISKVLDEEIDDHTIKKWKQQ